MRLFLLAVTPGGERLARRLAAAYPGGADVAVAGGAGGPRAADLVAAAWGRYRGLVLFLAVGAAVRLVAPHLRDKRRDPAVVAVDEGGRFAVSLVSGHLGGANALAAEVAGYLGACPVITTASDGRGLPALDLVLRAHRLWPDPPEGLRRLQGRLVAGEPVSLRAVPALAEAARKLARDLPGVPLREAREGPPEEGEMVLSDRDAGPPVPGGVYLRPRRLAAGVGCRRGVAGEEVLEAVRAALAMVGLSPLSLAGLYSAELKRDEAGLAAAAAALGVPLGFFPAEELQRCIKEDGLARSALVRRKIGVDGVCEPAAILGGGPGARLVLGKTVVGRVTVALAEGASGW